MYIVYGHFNDIYFFYDRADVRRCRKCNYLISKWDEDLTIVPIRKFKRLDVGASYDGIDVFSSKVKTIYEQWKMSGLQFTQLAHPDLYAVRASAVVRYDSERRGTRFEEKCEVCGQYKSVIGAAPAYLKADAHLPPLGFARTDLEFGSEDGKHPLLLCGDEAAKILKAAKLKGLDLEKVKE